MDTNILIIVAICVCALVLVLVLIEAILTLRRIRSDIGRLVDTTCETCEQVQPVVQKLDAALDDLHPTIVQLEPLALKSSQTLDTINRQLEATEDILSDVSKISAQAAGVSTTLDQAAKTAISGIAKATSSVASNFLQGYTSAKNAIEKGLASPSDDETPDRPLLTHQEPASSSHATTSYISYAAVSKADVQASHEKNVSSTSNTASDSTSTSAAQTQATLSDSEAVALDDIDELANSQASQS